MNAIQINDQDSFGISNYLLVLAALYVCTHCFCSRLPVGRADLSMEVNILESFDQSQVLVGVSTDWEIVDWWMLDDTVSVNDVGGSECNSWLFSVFAKTSIGFWDGFVQIWDQRNTHLSKASLLSWLQTVLHMRELWVDWTGQDLTSDFFEFFSLVAEGNDFCWADEGKIKWVKEEKNILSLVVLNVDMAEFWVKPCFGVEVWGGFSDQWHNIFS